MDIPFGAIAVRCLEDERFREAVLKQPEAALQKVFDIEIPKGHKIKAVEDTAEVVHLIVPASNGSRGAEVGLVSHVLDRMRVDKEFRRNVIERPRKTFEKSTGVKLPDSPKFVILIDDKRITHISVPANEPNKALAATAQAASDDSWGGGGSGYGGEEPISDTDNPCSSFVGNNSSQAICCQSQSKFPNTPSAFDCCIQTATPGGDSPIGSSQPVILPF